MVLVILVLYIFLAFLAGLRLGMTGANAFHFLIFGALGVVRSLSCSR